MVISKSANGPKILLVTIANSLGLLQNLCEFNNRHTHVYQCEIFALICPVLAEIFGGIY